VLEGGRERRVSTSPRKKKEVKTKLIIIKSKDEEKEGGGKRVETCPEIFDIDKKGEGTETADIGRKDCPWWRPKHGRGENRSSGVLP